jgi:integrase
MPVIWKKVKNYLGVRYREHRERKHGVVPDRCFSIRYKVKVNGKYKDKEEVVGWASEGMNPEKASKKLSVIRENIRSGIGPQSIAATRDANTQQAEEEEKARRLKERSQITFSEFWQSEYLPAAEATKKPTTMESERWLYSKWIAPALGDIPLQNIDAGKLEKLALYAQKSGKSAATIRYILAIVSQVWNKAAARDLVQGDSPSRRVKKPRQDNRRVRFLSPDEARTLLATLALRSMDIHDTALLSLFCGLRAGEIHALKWGDIDQENEIIHIRDPKNKNDRHAFITQEAKEMFARRYAAQAKSELVFPATNGEQRRWVSDTFSRTVDDMGLNDTGKFTTNESGESVPVKIADARQRVVFHTLRHTFASWLVQDGTPLYTVAELMGHNSLEMTRRYSHLDPDSLRKATMSLQGKLLQKSATVVQFKNTAAS